MLRLCLLLVCLLSMLFLFWPGSEGARPKSVLGERFGGGPGMQIGLASLLQRPVLERDFPDPGAIEADGVFFSFGTNSNGKHVPVARSEDLVRWSLLPEDALPILASWVRPSRNMVWAPEVIKIGSSYRMYYTAPDRASRRQCIGVASSEQPGGPYRDHATAPLICPPGFSRAIDANPFEHDGQLYLYFSGVWGDSPNGIYAQKLSADGLSTAGPATLVLRVGADWEGTIAEAPTMLRHEGRLYLFYSGNDWGDETYAVGYAVCKTPAGPCLKSRDNPLIATSSIHSEAIGPGHQAILKVRDEFWMIYHGWQGVAGYEKGGRRVLWVQPFEWLDGKPSLRPLVDLRS